MIPEIKALLLTKIWMNTGALEVVFKRYSLATKTSIAA